MKRLFATVCYLALLTAGLSGCASFKMGAVCYFPYGQSGTCQSLQPIAQPVAPAASATGLAS